MFRDRVSVIAALVALLGTTAVAHVDGWGPFSREPDLSSIDLGDDPGTGPETGTTPAPGPDERKPFPPAVNGVHTLYDDTWSIEEGQWSLGGTTYEEGPTVHDPSFTTMLESVGPGSAYVTTPGFYGDFEVVVELDDAPPAVPSWCEDAAEVSLGIGGAQPSFEMASFETFSDQVAVPAGTYRVRYCAERQDEAAAQGEDAEDVYAGRHLIQLWKAPRLPDRVLRTGSRWAKELAKG